MATGGLVFQCVACRALIVANGVVVEGARAGLSCSACNTLSWLPTIDAGVAVDVASAMPTVTRLPALSTPLVLAAPLPEIAVVAAPTTALVSAAATAMTTAFDPLIIARVEEKTTLPASEAQTRLAARFTRLLTEQWHSDVEHKQLLKAAAADNELAFVGARYRAVLDVVREEPRARAAQQELIGLAMATMQPATVTSSSGNGALIAKVLLGLMIVGGLIGAGIAVARWMASSMAPLSSIE